MQCVKPYIYIAAHQAVLRLEQVYQPPVWSLQVPS